MKSGVNMGKDVRKFGGVQAPPFRILTKKMYMTAEQSVYNLLAHRAKIVSSSQEALDRELQHIRRALQACQFPNWALNQLQHKFLRYKQPNQDTNHNNNSTQTNNNNTINSNNRSISIVVPYIQRTAERFKEVCRTKPKAYKYISRALTPLEHSWSHSRIKNYTKVVSSTISSASTSTVLKHT